jgi:hypothetical protein
VNLVSVIAEQGLALVFAHVFLQQLGVPIPAEPTLVVAGSLAARGLLPLPGLVEVDLAGGADSRLDLVLDGPSLRRSNSAGRLPAGTVP